MKKILLYMTSLAALVVFSGCEDFLKREPHLQQSTDITLSTYSGLNDATHGAYANIGSTGWYGQGWVINCEMRSGNGMKSTFANTNRFSQPYNWNYTEDNTSGMWSNAYVTIAMANNVIDNLEGKDVDGVTAQDLDNLKAECLFIRALAHFCNVLTYGQPYTYCAAQDRESLGVPYVYHTDPKGKPKRETVLSNYDNIVKDLLDAEACIDPDYVATSVRKGLADPLSAASLPAIQALLSRVYLYMGKWQEAANYATKVIKNPKFEMWTAEEYPDVWGQELGSGEVIFEVYGKRSNSAYGNWEDISYVTNPKGYGDAQAAQPLIDLYAEGDVRLEAYMTDENEESGRLWTAKYPGKGDNPAPDCNNVVVLRLSEMYLNRAEALMRGATIEGATAISDLNMITSHRGAAPYSSVGPIDIQTERRKELAWEGHHIYDLARWGMPVEREAADYPLLTDNFDIPFPSTKWALPLPKSEIDVNGNLEQNPK